MTSNTVEEWRPIRGFEDLYEVSSLGRVRRKGSKKINSGRTYRGGLRYAVLFNENYETVIPLERVVAEAFYGELSPGESVFFAHDDNDYSLENLVVGDDATLNPCDCQYGFPEEWRAIPGWEERYEVSNHGRVRQLWHIFSGEKVYEKSMIRRTPTRERYWRTILHIPGEKRQQYYTSELVLSAFVGPRPAGFHACHKDDVRLDDHINVLRWGTVQENIDEKTMRRRRDDGLPTECPDCGLILLPRNCYPGLHRTEQLKCKSCHIAEAAYAKKSSQW